MKKLVLSFVLCSVFCLLCGGESSAAVVLRANLSAAKPAAAPTTARPSVAGTRMPSISAAATLPAPAPEEIIPEPTEPEPAPIENKSSSFAEIFNDSPLGASANDGALSEAIRNARAAAAASETGQLVQSAAAANNAGANACDTAIRNCMKEKCGNDFSKCALDGDTFWGDKIESCKRNTQCAGDEFRAVSDQIKADRDFNATIARYESIMSCGRQYNSCISERCGNGYAKCLGKSGEDVAVSECAKVSQKCLEADSGLQKRTSMVLADLRVDAEKNVASWEKQLYAMRDKMQDQCNKMGAMFDTRSLECVFTVEFMANNDGAQTLFASKKLNAGSGYQCTPEWFGIDITTFKENAIRLTRAQSGASSAMLGAGLGTAAGAISSGAIGRAIDSQKAERAIKAEEKAQKEADKKSEEKPDAPKDDGDVDKNVKGKSDSGKDNDNSRSDNENLMDDKNILPDYTPPPASENNPTNPDPNAGVLSARNNLQTGGGGQTHGKTNLKLRRSMILKEREWGNA